jgi:3-isopropylmalate dehydrogenase
MMLRYSFHLDAEAKCVEAGVASVLEAGHRTRDLAKRGQATIGTAEMGREIVSAIKERMAFREKQPARFTA